MYGSTSTTSRNLLEGLQGSNVSADAIGCQPTSIASSAPSQSIVPEPALTGGALAELWLGQTTLPDVTRQGQTRQSFSFFSQDGPSGVLASASASVCRDLCASPALLSCGKQARATKPCS